MTKVNCTQFQCGKCLHPAAPRGWFGPSNCIVLAGSPDPQVIVGCALQAPITKPPSPRSPYSAVPRPQNG